MHYLTSSVHSFNCNLIFFYLAKIEKKLQKITNDNEQMNESTVSIF